jgi:hypothetical protein
VGIVPTIAPRLPFDERYRRHENQLNASGHRVGSSRIA